MSRFFLVGCLNRLEEQRELPPSVVANAVATADAAQAQAPEGLGYQNLFRIVLMAFIDAHSFDVRSVKKSCIHIAHPDGKRLIPFDTFNMFYRGELEQTRLAGLRNIEAGVV